VPAGGFAQCSLTGSMRRRASWRSFGHSSQHCDCISTQQIYCPRTEVTTVLLDLPAIVSSTGMLSPDRVLFGIRTFT